ncbi:MAG: VOC family protein [Rhodobacteraceae bacterium]|nr:VOC family protein [Paracoccaceae bacterium]
MWIDHVVVTAPSLEEGAALVAGRLGRTPVPGGRHALMGTHNLLLGLGPGLYLEVIAIDPAAPPPGRPRWFRLDERRGGAALTNWVARTGDLDAALAAAPPGAGLATDLARGDYRWRFGVPDDGRLPFDDVFPALIEWRGGRHPADDLPDSGCRLAGLTLRHPDAAGLRLALGAGDARLRIEPGPAGLSARIALPGGGEALL